MGNSVDRLIRLARTKVVVPPHVRIKNGRREMVEGYTYDRKGALVEGPKLRARPRGSPVKPGGRKFERPDVRQGVQAEIEKAAGRRKNWEMDPESGRAKLKDSDVEVGVNDSNRPAAYRAGQVRRTFSRDVAGVQSAFQEARRLDRERLGEVKEEEKKKEREKEDERRTQAKDALQRERDQRDRVAQTRRARAKAWLAEQRFDTPDEEYDKRVEELERVLEETFVRSDRIKDIQARDFLGLASDEDRAEMDRLMAEGPVTTEVSEYEIVDLDNEGNPIRAPKPERLARQQALIDGLWIQDGADRVPNEGKAIIAGGIPGAGKTTVLRNHMGLGPRDYFTVSPDEVKQVMAVRGMIPEVEGMSPMDSASLVHEESSDIAKALAARAERQRKNVIWDISMSSVQAVENRVADLRANGYSEVREVFVDINPETAVKRAKSRHRRGWDAWRSYQQTGRAPSRRAEIGGRFMPPSIIRASAQGTTTRNYINYQSTKGLFDESEEWENNGDRPIKRTSVVRTERSFSPTGQGTRESPIRTSDVSEAARLIGEGKHVELAQERQVSTLLDKLAELVQEAKKRGEEAPVYDLCKVSVSGTNLFCVESKGVARVKMPQLAGFAEPGSPADAFPKNKDGEVDLGPEFARHLQTLDISVEETEVEAKFLRASQRELNGIKVAGMETFLEGGGEIPGSIFVSNDDYVVDGHHRWAATVARGIEADEDLTVPVRRINTDIITILREANRWTARMGLKRQEV